MKLRRHDITDALATRSDRSRKRVRGPCGLSSTSSTHGTLGPAAISTRPTATPNKAQTPGDDDQTAVPRLQHVRAFAINLQGLLAQERERFDLAAAKFREALEIYETAAVPDAWVPAYSTANLAILARDFASTTSSADLERRIERVRWSAGTSAQRFISLHGLGWARMHEGDHLGALRTFHAAADIAPSPAFKVMAWVDHANLGRTIGAGLVAIESALYARDEAEAIRWEEVNDNERIVLLFVAGSTAALDPARARQLLRRYEATHRSDELASGIVCSDNVLWRCFELHAEATVLRAEGFIARAATLLHEEYEHWQRIGSETRAAVAQHDLRDIRESGRDVRRP